MKKICCFGLALFLLPLICFPVRAETVWGDADGDGAVSSADLLRLRLFWASFDYSSGASPVKISAGGDADGDGQVSSADLLLLRRYFACFDYSSGTSSVRLGPTGSPAEENGKTVSLDGKKVMFIGNSALYFGGAVSPGDPMKTDEGWFWQLCRANGEKCSVYDFTWGGKDLGFIYQNYLRGQTFTGFDFVFLTEANTDSSETWETIRKIMGLFSGDTEFFYLNHAYTVYQCHSRLIGQFGAMRKGGVRIIDWGKALFDLAEGRASLPDGMPEFSAADFFGSKGTPYQPNPLAGYLTALMAYCTVTGRPAVGLPDIAFETGQGLLYGGSAVGFDEFVERHYDSPTDTHFPSIMASGEVMRALRQYVDFVLASKTE